MRVKDYFREALSDLGKSNALGFHIVILVLIYPPLIGLLQPPPPGYDLPIPMIWYDVAGSASVAILLMVAKVLLQKRRTSLARNMTAWIFAASFGVLAQLALLTALGDVPRVYLDSGAFGLLTNLGLLLLFHFISSGIVNLVRHSRSLATKRSQVEAIAATLQQRLEHQGSQLRQTVAFEVLPMLDTLSERLRQRSAQSSLSTEFITAIEQRIRPLSHSLEQGQLTEVIAGEQSVETMKESRITQTLRQKSTLVSTSGVSMTMFAFLLFSVPTHIFLFGAEVGTLAALTMMLLWGLIAYSAARLALKKRFSLLTCLASNLALGLVAGLLSFEIRLLEIPNIDPGLSAFVSLQIVLIVFFAHTHSTLLDASWLALQNLEQVLRKEEKLLLKMQVALELQSRRLAYLVHGRVQATLQAISIRLTQPVVDQGTEIETLDALAANLTEQFNSAPALASQVGSFESLCELWDGVCEVEIAFESDSRERISSDEQLSIATLLVVEEFVTNSVKHGSADRVSVRFGLEQTDQVWLEAVSFGESVAADSVQPSSSATDSASSSGIGSKIFESMTDTWSTNQIDGRFTLRATF